MAMTSNSDASDESESAMQSLVKTAFLVNRRACNPVHRGEVTDPHFFHGKVWVLVLF